jgi:hypothetical protein
VTFEHEGKLHAPFATALDLAVSFAAAEPATVLGHIDIEQRRYEIEMKEPGQAYKEPLVNRWRAGWALTRQWAGRDADLAARDEEIARLRDLITRHLVDVRFIYPESAEPRGIALKLERALKGRYRLQRS